MRSTTIGSKKSLRIYTSTLVLALAACGAPVGSVSTDVASETEALVAQPGGTAQIADESVVYLQRQSLASIGSTPVTLVSGEIIDPGTLAINALARHRTLEQEVAGAGSALLAP